MSTLSVLQVLDYVFISGAGINRTSVNKKYTKQVYSNYVQTSKGNCLNINRSCKN